MIQDWRKKFYQYTNILPFFFVQLSPYTHAPDFTSLPALRQSQMAALKLPDTAMACIIDAGDPFSPFINIHPRNKQVVGYRLYLAAQNIVYKDKSVIYRGPTFQTMTVKQNPPKVVVEVSFDPASIGSGLTMQPAYCPNGFNVSYCNWADIQTSDGKWNNVTSIALNGNTVDFYVTVASSLKVTGIRYAYGDWPIAQIFNKNGLPALPFIYTNQ